MADTLSSLPKMDSVWQQSLGWQPTDQQQRQFQQLYELILEGNRQFNLTRITDSMEFWEKHLWDSLRGIAPLLKSQPVEVQLASMHSIQRAIDIGTGAGFPGIAIAIAQPGWIVTLLDATRKKIAFLKTLLAALDVENVTTLTSRAEQVGQHPDHRETYDIALVRAVGPVSVCAEYALPLLRTNGLAILYRGQWTDSDTLALQPAVEKLGGLIESTEGFRTPVSQSVRHCLYIRKATSTPLEFPRSVGLPTQQPL